MTAATFDEVYDFPLDDFQHAGIAALAAGRSTLVAAPTGAGKTVVGEYAVWRALQQGAKCFYTTPIKALSNQKFNDLVEHHGIDAVGLLTGDRVINGDAPIVVMTTEVLRNMLYEASSALAGLQSVVLDEVHYLADRERGAVWEEVIIQLPAQVQLACLSATVSNAEEFGEWLGRVDSACDVVISERRPVPLEHHYAVNDRLYHTFRSGHAKIGSTQHAKARSEAARQALAGVPNPEVVMLERRSAPGGRPSRSGRRQHGGARLRAPRRSELVAELRRRRWLPAIYFLFSRNGCDDAVGQLMRDGVRLTTPRERQTIRALVEERTAELPAEDLAALGYGVWLTGLEHGIAAHHAGLVPLFKETVEALFVRGLVKVCFATETLALGINMPARTVVIERLEKWTGQAHELLTPGQFTQLTGRAGRRGLDTVGHAVVAYQRDIAFPTVASLVGRRTEPLRSSFAPSYNMAVNLLRRRDRAAAEALLARSFAQYQADHNVGDVEERIARNREALAGYAQNLHSDAGDFDAYWCLRRELSRLESGGAKDRRRRREAAINAGLAELREGDVVAMGRGARPDLAAVVATSTSAAGTPLARVVTEDRRLSRIGPREFDAPPAVVGSVPLPGRGGPRQSAWRKQVASQLRSLDIPSGAARSAGSPDDRHDPDVRARIERLRAELAEHPVHTDPRLPEIEVWARRHDDLADDTTRLERQMGRRTGSLVRAFARIVDLLTELGYLTDHPDDPRPTAHGRALAGLYAETDLVLAEALRRGVLDGLDGPDLAAVVSAFVHEARLKDPPPPAFPNALVAERFAAGERVWSQIHHREEDAGLPPTRPLDPGFAEIVWRWASGADLDDALGVSELTAGDFVRNVKRVADLLRQVRDVRAGDPVGEEAHAAAKSLMRGVVAYSA
ncbi:MAG: DEAD/DEAH box helicase [Euzebyales bacterium]|nr:DEAD/DEAH box helicase [Euzebyales bacterium]